MGFCIYCDDIWKPIPGWEYKYEISSLAKVRNKKTGKILKQAFKGKGKREYLYVSLKRYYGGKGKKPFRKHIYPHRVVYQVFHFMADMCFEVNHDLPDKTRNEWWAVSGMTRQQNMQHYHLSKGHEVKQELNEKGYPIEWDS